jgi:hypothetical protein
VKEPPFSRREGIPNMYTFFRDRNSKLSFCNLKLQTVKHLLKKILLVILMFYLDWHNFVINVFCVLFIIENVRKYHYWQLED